MDYNFFDPVKKTKKASGLSFLLIILIVVVTALLLIFMGFRFFQYQTAKTQIERMQAELNSERFVETMALLTETRNKIDDFTFKQIYLQGVSRYVENEHIVSWDRLNTLSSEIPVNLSLDNISINRDSISLSGNGTDIVPIAQYEHNIRELGIYDEINVASMSRSEEQGAEGSYSFLYSFTMTMNIKDQLALSLAEESANDVGDGEEGGDGSDE